VARGNVRPRRRRQQAPHPPLPPASPPPSVALYCAIAAPAALTARPPARHLNLVRLNHEPGGRKRYHTNIGLMGTALAGPPLPHVKNIP
jgi:hypothetical protein